MSGERKYPIACIFMASGSASRFGENKLLVNFQGRTLIEATLADFPRERFEECVVVTRFEEVACTGKQHGYRTLLRGAECEDISGTIREGLKVLREDGERMGCMFLVCDQPELSAESVIKLAAAFMETPDRIVAVGYKGQKRNPIVFPKAVFSDLANLPHGSSGSYVIRLYPELLRIVDIENSLELVDIDTQADLETLCKSRNEVRQKERDC